MYEAITFVLIGITFFIYSFLCCKKRKVIYIVTEPEFIIIDDRYFNLQLKASIMNSIIIIIGGILFNVSQLGRIKSITPFIAILIFWLINYCLRNIAVRKEYAQIGK